ncbi:hypothetical protein [Wolbachia endosymbiont (group A) of Cheilosia soror]|uniref:hypothetical protein n=1 Tax=Wolbachia endosymbiont (group A) of Cheilosia soror TaxID=2953995 RepID=UPI0021F8EE68|nr:hypothetical protein [Wolbachia endosymbiont (group A) of Cheilosia soror]
MCNIELNRICIHFELLNYSAIEYRSQLYKHCSLSPIDPSALFLSSQCVTLGSHFTL